MECSRDAVDWGRRATSPWWIQREEGGSVVDIWSLEDFDVRARHGLEGFPTCRMRVTVHGPQSETIIHVAQTLQSICGAFSSAHKPSFSLTGILGELWSARARGKEPSCGPCLALSSHLIRHH